MIRHQFCGIISLYINCLRGDDEFINPNNPHCFYFNRCLLDFVSGQQKRVFNKNPEHVLLFNSRF